MSRAVGTDYPRSGNVGGGVFVSMSRVGVAVTVLDEFDYFSHGVVELFVCMQTGMDALNIAPTFVVCVNGLFQQRILTYDELHLSTAYITILADRPLTAAPSNIKLTTQYHHCIH